MTRTQTDPGEHSRNRLDAQLVDLIESVMSCERAARREDRLDATIAAAVRYGRR
ncbi:MAG TPA: hypothetical protein VH134_17855 [Candidatus Dormibacteraeota bacterium]|nr:hypothetical protein [Candidatus Dormibacteraeota bacterium]